MKWNQVQLTAKARNQLVFAMNQGEQPRPTFPMARDTSALDEGYCMGLSIHWIEQLYAGRNFPYVALTQEYNEIDWIALDLYQKYDAQPIVRDGSYGWKNAVALRNMRVCLGLKAEQWLKKPTGRFLCDAVRKAWGCYGVTLSGSGGQHAIAIRHARDNTFHLFDPNHGHFAVKWIDRFQPFLDWYLTETRYAEWFASGNIVLGVRPPHQ